MFNSVSGSSVNKGISGLASGMDTDTLVDSMTLNTQSKIDQKNQEKQYINWKKEAYRTIAGGMMEFDNQYFSYASKDNILASNFFTSFNITNLSDHVKLSGNLQNAQNIIINDIKQIASKSEFISSRIDNKLDLSGEIRENWNTSDLAGKTFNLKVDGKNYSLKIHGDFGKNIDENSTPNQKQEAVAKELQRLVDGHKDLAGKITIGYDGSGDHKNLAITHNDGKKISFSGETDEMGLLGFTSKSVTGDDGGITGQSSLDTSKVFKQIGLADQLAGKSLKVNFNGVGKTITIDEEKLRNAITNSGGPVDNPNDHHQSVGLKSYLQEELDKAFGVDKILVNQDDSTKISLKSKNEGSSLAISGGSADLLGEKGILGLKVGATDKPNNNTTLDQLAMGGASYYQSFSIQRSEMDNINTRLELKGLDGELVLIDLNHNYSDSEIEELQEKYGLEITSTKDPLTDEMTYQFTATGDYGISRAVIIDPDNGDQATTADIGHLSNGRYELTINDVKIEFDGKDSLAGLASKINQSGAGVSVSYSSLTSTFVLTSKEFGANNQILFGGSEESKGFAKEIFGISSIDDQGVPSGGQSYSQGQDSIVEISVNGVKQTIERSSNVISVDGLNIELVSQAKDENGVDLVENISFNVTNDVDAVIDRVKDFIESYNSILDTINLLTSERPNKNYSPLTDAQKKAMSEDQIKQWELEAKKGVLYNDPALKKVANDLRSALFAPVKGMTIMMTDIGIKTGDWSMKGKLEIDETKLRKALLENPDQVAQLFTKKSSVDYSPELKSEEKKVRYSESGLMERFGDILKGAVGTTTPKGSLLQIAGIANDRTENDNKLNSQVKNIDKDIENLMNRLNTERTRYYNQFTAMEKYINEMNQQNAWLLQQFGQ